MKTVLVLGAGATVAEAIKPEAIKPEEKIDVDKLPPVDNTFFSQTKNSKNFFKSIANYTLSKYGIDLFKQFNNYGLEYIFNIIYSETKNFSNKSSTKPVLPDLMNLLKILILETTNKLEGNNENGIFGLLKLINNKIDILNNLNIITFNYDLMIEKCLSNINEFSETDALLDIHNCYDIEFDKHIKVPVSSMGYFNTPMLGDTIKIYKLHGSLNWHVGYKDIKEYEKFFPEKPDKIILTENKDCPFGVHLVEEKMLAHPLIVPPIYEKNKFYSDKLEPIWHTANVKLSEAEKIIIFGYSLPEADIKAHVMFLSAISQNKNLKSIDIIDKNPSICQRYVEKLNLDSISYYKSVEEYKKKN